MAHHGFTPVSSICFIWLRNPSLTRSNASQNGFYWTAKTESRKHSWAVIRCCNVSSVSVGLLMCGSPLSAPVSLTADVSWTAAKQASSKWFFFSFFFFRFTAVSLYSDTEKRSAGGMPLVLSNSST